MEKYIGRNVKLYMGFISEITKPFIGIIKSVDGDWVVLEEKKKTQLINIKKISRVILED